jgi:hypothetical protein
MIEKYFFQLVRVLANKKNQLVRVLANKRKESWCEFHPISVTRYNSYLYLKNIVCE